MTDDKIPFLRARLDEDERIARRVESSWRQVGETGVIVASDGERAEECANGNWAGIAEHIVQHDPARALREVHVKKARLALYEGALQRWADLPGGERPTVAGENLRIKVTTLEVVIQGDLQAYADHPDFRRDWLM